MGERIIMTVHYKNSDFSNELAFLMKKELEKEAAEESTSAEKITNGLNCLNKAASIFEDLQHVKTAEAITTLLEKLTGEK